MQEITGIAALGALLFQLLHPFLPDFAPADKLPLSSKHGDLGSPRGGLQRQQSSKTAMRKPTERRTTASGIGGAAEQAAVDGDLLAVPVGGNGSLGSGSGSFTPLVHQLHPRPAELLRLGLVMSLTMTLHNLPEGFAVCFSAFTDFGPVMAIAIALHNVSEDRGALDCPGGGYECLWGVGSAVTATTRVASPAAADTGGCDCRSSSVRSNRWVWLGS